MSGINLDLMKESGKYPFGVCQTGVCSNAFFCDGCLCRIHKKYSACSMILISGAPDSSIIRRTVNEVNVHDEKLKAVLKFCYLGGMLCL